MIALVEFFNYRPSLFSARKYKIIVSFVLLTIINIQLSVGQEVNAYRTRASGNFHNPAIWQTFTGTAWVAATVKPDRNNDIYIENPHLVTLIHNEEVKSVFLNAALNANQKLNINGRELSVYGSLNAFEGNAPGSPRGAWNSVNWIGNNVNSRIVFRGNSRVVVTPGSWSGFSTRSEYSVIFDPGEGQVLTVETHFKANRFIIRSGKVIQKVITGNCAMLSFNTNPSYVGFYGELVIENGGELESECNNNISLRSESGNTPSALFDLQPGGQLTLLGNNPQIHSAEIRFNGTVRYANSTAGNQNFVTSNLTGSMIQRNYRHLYFFNNSIKVLPPTLNISGDFIRAAGSGMVADNSTDFTLSGEHEQAIIDPDFHPTHFTLNKTAGTAFLHQDLRIKRNFNMVQGSMDFMGNTLLFQTTFDGAYTYTSGRWINLEQVNYLETPIELNETNASFPFNDDELGGIRKLSLSGNIGSSFSSLVIRYVQVPGVNWNAEFEDHDGTPILYKTNSYFDILAAPFSDNPVQMVIDADDLIVLDPAHLRIVSDNGPSPGEHLEGVEAGEQFLARRALEFADLLHQTFAIGSTGLPSILPVLWLHLEAKAIKEGILLTWMDDIDDRGEKFIIRRSFNNIENFQEVGIIEDFISADSLPQLSYLDTTLMNSGWLYYQVEKIGKDGLSNISPVVRVHWTQEKQRLFNLYPIPYTSGTLGFELVENIKAEHGIVNIYDKSGNILWTYEGELGIMEEEFINNLKLQSPGLYLIEMLTASDRQMVKWIKK